MVPQSAHLPHRPVPADADRLPAALIEALRGMHQRLTGVLALVPATALNFKPADWAAIPGERFSIIEQVCHLRDIELDGYQQRIQRMLAEDDPQLVSVDGYRLARERDYTRTNIGEAAEAFRLARGQTLALLETLDPAQLSRPGRFAEHGRLSLTGLIHLLCSHDQIHLASIHALLAAWSGSNGRGPAPSG